MELPPDLVQRVNTAINSGANLLKGAWENGAGNIDLATEYPGGLTALVYYTLRVCDVPTDDPLLVSLYAQLRREFAAAKRARRLYTYTVALVMLCIEHHETRAADVDRRAGVETQLSDEDARWMRECVALLERWQSEEGTWWYGEPGVGPSGRKERAPRGARMIRYDQSNSQFALLGLKAASRSGVKVRSRTYRRALAHWIRSQQKDGPAVARSNPRQKGSTSDGSVDRARGWSYVGLDTPGLAPTARLAAYGSMTAGGVSSIVICRSELLGTANYSRKLDDAAETALRDGLAWLGHHFSVSGHPGREGDALPNGVPGDQVSLWHFYYLYALERAGRLSGADWMGGHDWYGEGAAFLVDQQIGNGGWSDAPDKGANILDTCFALLFLRRGTPPVSRGAVTQALDETSLRFDAARKLSGKDFEDFVDLVLSRWRRASDAAARERITAKTAELGPRIVWPLLSRLASEDEEKRVAAHAVLTQATGKTFGYDPRGAREAREAALPAWEGWYVMNRERLAYDPATGRITATD